jgi:hypothetical protein
MNKEIEEDEDAIVKWDEIEGMDGWLWPLCDTLWWAKQFHLPENRNHLIDTEAYLHGWSESVYLSEMTASLWQLMKEKK